MGKGSDFARGSETWGKKTTGAQVRATRNLIRGSGCT